MGAQSSQTYIEAGAKGVLSILSPWLEDNLVSEIMINKPYEVFIEKGGEMQSFEVPELSPLYLRRMFTLIANESGQVFDQAMPLLSANLYDGSRVQLAMPPTAKEFTLSIRRKSIKNLSLDDYANTPFFDSAKHFSLHSLPSYTKEVDSDDTLLSLYKNKKWSDFLRKAIKARKNIVISGGTSSGKTTFLNALLQEIPHEERLITLEDTREVMVPHKNSVSLLSSKGEQGIAKVSMQDLVQSCLRLRPDRIIMGEIRGAEIMDFVSACSTGHEGSMTSIHANNPRVAFMRMTQMYKLNNVPSMRDEDILRELNEVIDVILQVGKSEGSRILQSCYYKGANAQ